MPIVYDHQAIEKKKKKSLNVLPTQVYSINFILIADIIIPYPQHTKSLKSILF